MDLQDLDGAMIEAYSKFLEASAELEGIIVQMHEAIVGEPDEFI